MRPEICNEVEECVEYEVDGPVEEEVGERGGLEGRRGSEQRTSSLPADGLKDHGQGNLLLRGLAELDGGTVQFE